MNWRLVAMLCVFPALAADRVATMPFESAKPVLDAMAAQLPEPLRGADGRAFAAWARAEDVAIRGRLERGDLDSMVNLLMFGTSFTTQARMTMGNFGAETRAGLLKARVDDLMAAMAGSAADERLVVLRKLLKDRDYPPRGSTTAAFILDNVQRVLKERIEFAEKVGANAGTTDTYRESASLFSQRGVSLDTTILPNYAIDAALRELKSRGLLKEKRVMRAAVVGPGLDFIDKEAGFDYYPQQTLQPFAILDSLAALGLWRGKPQVTILDISPRVLEHVKAARVRASKGQAYTIELPRSAPAAWTQPALEYWRGFAGAVGENVKPLSPPVSLDRVETRAVRIPAAAVLELDAADVNIVSQRLTLADAQKFDLVVATNILVYYGPFEQGLALANIAAMLNPGGFLLTNDELAEIPGIPMRNLGHTAVVHTESPRLGDAVIWYERLAK